MLLIARVCLEDGVERIVIELAKDHAVNRERCSLNVSDITCRALRLYREQRNPSRSFTHNRAEALRHADHARKRHRLHQ